MAISRVFALGGKVLLCVAGALLLSGRVEAKEDCEVQDVLMPRTTLELKSVRLDRDGTFVGLFELANVDLAPTLTLPGERGRRHFLVSRPEAQVQFKDFNGIWQTHVPAMEEFTEPAEKLTLLAGSKAWVEAPLVSHAQLRHNRLDFRLVLHFSAPRKCIYSMPFRASPTIAPARSLRTISSARN